MATDPRNLEGMAKARAAKAALAQPKGPMTLFKTEKFSAVITKAEALLVAPRFAIIKRPSALFPNGKRKERLETMYHRYHKSFAAAKTYLLAEWRIELSKARERLVFLETQYAKIEQMTESDL